MLVTSNTWGPALQTEALKFWGYSLAVSVLLGLYNIFFVYPGPPSPSTSDKGNNRGKQIPEPVEKTSAESTPKASTTPQSARQRTLYKQLVADSCDFLIPSAMVGWVRLDPITVGVAGSISALLGGSDVWARVNG